jgi:hypothetical protein
MKSPAPGREVDSYCTRCKMDLNHRIIAMEGERIARVECLTCHGHHNYRRPKSAPDLLASPRRATRRSEAPLSGERAPRSRRALDPRKRWEEAIMGRAPDDFTAYRLDAPLSLGQLIRHKKFGDGVVAQVLEGGKVEVLFEGGAKTLVHAG